MLGLGRYKTYVNHMLYKGEVIFGFTDKGGEYGVIIEAANPPMPIPQIVITNTEENGSTLTGTASTPAMPGRTVDFTLDFEGDRCNGSFKVPFLGKIKIEDAVKISD